MKVVHVLKRIEMIDDDVRDLRKLEKQLKKNKTFSSPIYMSIEKQINILLGDRIKLLELTIANPPAFLVEQIEGTADKNKEEKAAEPAPAPEPKKSRPSAKNKQNDNYDEDDDDIDGDLNMLTQDLIDAKIKDMESDKKSQPKTTSKPEIKVSPKAIDEDDDASASDDEDDITRSLSKNDDHLKLLDVALTRNSINSETKAEAEKDRKKVKFFKNNFPGGEY